MDEIAAACRLNSFQIKDKSLTFVKVFCILSCYSGRRPCQLHRTQTVDYV